MGVAEESNIVRFLSFEQLFFETIRIIMQVYKDAGGEFQSRLFVNCLTADVLFSLAVVYCFSFTLQSYGSIILLAPSSCIV